MRGLLKELLRGHLLPRLLAEASPPAWIHFAEEAVAFEGQLAQVRRPPPPPRPRAGAQTGFLGPPASSEAAAMGPPAHVPRVEASRRAFGLL